MNDSQTHLNNYWVIPGKLLAGEYPGDQVVDLAIKKLQWLIDMGVNYFIDLTGENDRLEPHEHLLASCSSSDIPHRRFPVTDLGVPESKQDMVAILDAIDNAITQGRVVYVHCWGGVGRTGTVVGCYLSRQGFKGQAALDELQQRWRLCPKSSSRPSPETRAQVEYILNWEE